MKSRNEFQGAVALHLVGIRDTKKKMFKIIRSLAGEVARSHVEFIAAGQRDLLALTDALLAEMIQWIRHHAPGNPYGNDDDSGHVSDGSSSEPSDSELDYDSATARHSSDSDVEEGLVPFRGVLVAAYHDKFNALKQTYSGVNQEEQHKLYVEVKDIAVETAFRRVDSMAKRYQWLELEWGQLQEEIVQFLKKESWPDAWLH